MTSGAIASMGALLVVGALSGCSDNTQEAGYCGAGHIDAAEFNSSEPRTRDGDLNLCVVAAGADEERNFVVDLARVNGRLVIDGSGLASTIVFPHLLAVDAIHFMGCAFSAAQLPQLAALEALYLACEPLTTRTDAFELSAAELDTLGTLYIYGQSRMSTPQLSHIGDAQLIEIEYREAVESPLSVAPDAVVGSLKIVGALGGIRGVNVAGIDTLTLEAPRGELREDAFPNLRRVQTLRIYGAVGLTQCAVDALLAQLSAPPDTIEIDTPLGACEIP